VSANNYGRVDEKNNVYVMDADTERLVGQYPDVPAEEALAFFTRKFDDLEAQVRILEQRVAAGITDAKSLRATHEHLTQECVEPKAVGDLQSLRDRLAKLAPGIEEAAEKAKIERDAAIARALEDKEAIAARAEAIVANLGGINWKKSAAEMTELFESWQRLQKEGPKVPKAQTDPIWKRFSQSRAKFEAGRRQYFASIDGKFKEAKQVKSDLVKRAEALVSKGADAATDYRKLQDEWKSAGRAGKHEDSLWAAFRAAGDAIFAAKKQQDAELEVSQGENLRLKQELATKAEAIKVDDIKEAKRLLSEIQAEWVKIGHVPKSEIRNIEGRLRSVQAKIADAEKQEWMRTDPAAKARSNSLVTQLEAVIADLEQELKRATDAKKKASIEEQIKARTALLEAAKNAVD
jgi:hypothetical protein